MVPGAQTPDRPVWVCEACCAHIHTLWGAVMSREAVDTEPSPSPPSCLFRGHALPGGAGEKRPRGPSGRVRGQPAGHRAASAPPPPLPAHGPAPRLPGADKPHSES